MKGSSRQAALVDESRNAMASMGSKPIAFKIGARRLFTPEEISHDPWYKARVTQMDWQVDDLLGRFYYKNQCNTIIAAGQSRLTRRLNPESPNCGSISTGV